VSLAQRLKEIKSMNVFARVANYGDDFQISEAVSPYGTQWAIQSLVFCFDTEFLCREISTIQWMKCRLEEPELDFLVRGCTIRFYGPNPVYKYAVVYLLSKPAVICLHETFKRILYGSYLPKLGGYLVLNAEYRLDNASFTLYLRADPGKRIVHFADWVREAVQVQNAKA